ncbi:MAG: hypothetical protein AVDCRST_MAG49-3118 [uncultured Thermomicrobiales bacterium]|uniref:Uncharacterized protein n=1 Tax=uncultured Thermomicrobiales bacterium TaxID=1645740 RepID=A0A6J4V1F1_9BACT|nr:MAG: hypothetical protein AVDCRST_MAG49-3118 [uncultured Thermomicrobiales bacterium]
MFKRLFITPTVVPLGMAAIIAVLVVAIGESLLANADPHATKDSILRPELWVAIVPALGLFAAAWVAAHRPAKADSLLEREVVIGDTPFFAAPPAPISVQVRNGPLGTIDDIGEGYTLYAQNGALARVVGIVPGSTENGRTFRGFMYANGLYGASEQLWIPFEAVFAVYPETKSAFLAIKGDETEHYGWSRMPDSMRRTPRPAALQ